MTTPARGAARRELLVNATLQVIAEEGVTAVTHRRVAAIAGVPIAATTYWFTSKEDLVATAFEVAAEHDIARNKTLAARDFNAGVDDAASVIADSLFEEFTEGRAMLTASVILMIEARHQPTLREISTLWGNVHSDTCAAILRKLGSVRPEVDGELLRATIDGLTLKRLIKSDSGNRDELEAHLRNQLEVILVHSRQPETELSPEV